MWIRSTVIKVKFGHFNINSLDIPTIAPKLQWESKIKHFSLREENTHLDSEACAPINASISLPVYESIGFFLVLHIKAGGWVVYFSPTVHFISHFCKYLQTQDAKIRPTVQHLTQRQARWTFCQARTEAMSGSGGAIAWKWS